MSYRKANIREEEKLFIETIAEYTAASLSWKSPSTANTSKYRIMSYFNEKGIDTIHIGIRNSVLYGWIGAVYLAHRLNDDIVEVADEHRVNNEKYIISEDNLRGIQSTIAQRMNSSPKISLDNKARLYLMDQLKDGMISHAEYVLRIEALDHLKEKNNEG